jgi:predicted nuclease of predicted toxin-antitoxin system
VRIIVDMNLSPLWIDFLTREGFEAVHWSTIGKATDADPVIIAYAKATDSIILTHDLDFGAILAVTGGDKPSVVQLRAQDTSHDVAGASVVEALKLVSTELATGALLTIDASRARLRLLPLKM